MSAALLAHTDTSPTLVKTLSRETVDGLNAALVAAGKPELPRDRASTLLFAMSQCIDSQDVREMAWRRRDNDLYFDYSRCSEFLAFGKMAVAS